MQLRVFHYSNHDQLKKIETQKSSTFHNDSALRFWSWTWNLKLLSHLQKIKLYLVTELNDGYSEMV